MTDINLKAFCADPDRRPELSEPFSAGEFTYASNGHVMVRVDRRDDCTDEPDGGKKVSVLVRYLSRLDSVTFSPFPAVNLPPVPPHVPKPCNDCEATGRIHSVACGKCHGTGMHTCHACNHEDDCEECNGYGRIERPARPDDTLNVTECENCEGTGDCSRDDDRLIYTRVGPYWIDRRYVVLMQSLPGIEIDLGHTAFYDGASAWDEPPILFRFDGGVGAIMPLRGPVPEEQRARASSYDQSPTDPHHGGKVWA